MVFRFAELIYHNDTSGDPQLMCNPVSEPDTFESRSTPYCTIRQIR